MENEGEYSQRHLEESRSEREWGAGGREGERILNMAIRLDRITRREEWRQRDEEKEINEKLGEEQPESWRTLG